MKRLVLLALVLALASPAYASSSSVLLVGNNTGGVVNGAQVLGATTGNSPVVSSQGSDANIGLIFTTQGSGALNLETAGAGNVILAPGSGKVVIPAFTASGIVFNDASGDLSSGTALPNGTTATTQSSGDNSTKVATTAYVDNATGASGGMVLLATVDASNQASVSFGSSYITSTYNVYKILIDSLMPVTNGVTFELQVSTDGGSTWKSSNYYWQLYASTFSSSASYIDLGGGQLLTNTANQVGQYEITFSNPSASNITAFFVNGALWNSSGTFNTIPLTGAYQTAGAINAVRFVFSSGNISTGNFHLYGLSGT